MLRVLLADDSPTARQLLSAILGAAPDMAVVGEAEDGLRAAELAARLKPDVVVMDILMPRADGYEATRRIMSETPTPIVLVTASTAAGEVGFSLAALRLGALAVLPKPPGPSSEGFERAASELVRTVRAMAGVKVLRLRGDAPLPAPARDGLRPDAPRPRPSRKVVAVAASTGGPAALYQVLSALPADFPSPVLVVQHISDGFTPGFAEWLGKAGPLRVKVASDGEALSAGVVLVAPDGRHLGTDGERALLSDAPPVGGFRPSASFLFESVAKASGRNAVAAILTGMGDDGLSGLHAVRRAGGFILAQDQATSVVFGMPGVAVAAGLPDVTLPLGSVAGSLLEAVRRRGGE